MWEECQNDRKKIRKYISDDARFQACFKELTGVDVKTMQEEEMARQEKIQNAKKDEEQTRIQEE